MARVPALLVLVLVTQAVILVPAPTAGAAASTDADYLVTLHGTPTSRFAHVLDASGIRVLESYPFISTLLVRGPSAEVRALQTLPEVASVVEDEPLTPLLERARATARADLPPTLGDDGGRNVTIAFVDSGFDADHPGFQGRIRAHVRFDRAGPSPGEGDRDGHGTHVAGILAGDGAESRDRRLHGFAPAAGIAALDISPSFTTSNAVRAFQWVYEHHREHDIRVLSNSWGREKEGARYDPDDPLIRASNALVAEGVVVVFSAGNRGEAGESSLTVEAMNPNVLTVGAASTRGQVERYSSRGPALDTEDRKLPWTKPDLVAVGTHVLSARTSAKASPDATGEERYYVVMNGTSMAAPQAAGAAALLLSRDPSLDPLVVHALLTRTARDVGSPGPDNLTGYGMLDVRAAIEALERAEGGPTVVKVVHHEPVHASGATTGAADALVLHSESVEVAERVEVPLRLDEGAEHVRLWFNWTGPGAFLVRLEGPGGPLGPFAPAGAGVIPIASPVSPGAWVLVAEPDGAATRADWTLEGSVAIVEAHVVSAEGTLPHARPLWGEAGFILPSSTWLDTDDLALRGLALAGLTAVGSYTVYRARRR